MARADLPIGTLTDVVVNMRENAFTVVGRDERGEYAEYTFLWESEHVLGPILHVILNVLDVLDEALAKVAALFGVEYVGGGGEGIPARLRSHFDGVDEVEAAWGRHLDSLRLGAFRVSARVATLYVPYMGHAATLNYVVFPIVDAEVEAESKSRNVVSGSVHVRSEGAAMLRVGIKTLGGMYLLAQSSPHLSPVLPTVANILGRLVRDVRDVVGLWPQI